MALIGEMQYLTIGEKTYSLPSGSGGSVTSVGVNNATNGGLTISGSPITSSGTIIIGHSNVLTAAQTTQAVYPIKIDKNGHISEYGSAVSIPTKVSDLTNDSGFITGMTILSYGSSTYAEALTAYQANKVVYCRASSNADPASGNQLRMAFLAYVNNQVTPTEFEFQYYRSVSTHTESQQGDQVFVYKLNSSGTWSVTTREASVKVAVTSPIAGSYSSGTYTISIADAYGDTKNPYGTKTANYVLAGPTSGSAAAPSFRALVANDIPDLSSSYASSSHTHTTTLVADTGTSSITLASAGKYKLTAGDTSVVFTMPTIPTVSYPVTSVNTKTGDVTLSASDVGAAATSHAHGNITSGGDITAAAPTIANGDQIVINDSSASKITNGPTFDGSTTNKYLSPKGTWESLPQGTAYQAGTGLSLSGTTFNHSNSVTAQTTSAVYPITIDAQGHISAYGSAVDVSPETLVVNVTATVGDDETVYTADKTYSEILAAINSGKIVSLRLTDLDELVKELSFTSYSDEDKAIQFDTLPNYANTFSLIFWIDGNISSMGGVIVPQITLNGSVTTSPSFYAPTSAGTSGYVLKSNGSGAPSWISATLTDQNVKTSAVTAATTIYLTGSTSSTASTSDLSKHASAAFYVTANSGTSGYTQLRLGNTTATSSAGGKEGQIRLYGTNATYYLDLKPGAIASSNKTITFPNATGTVALTSDLSSFLSSASLTGTYNSSTKDLTLSITTS